MRAVALVETSIGGVGLAVTERGVAGVHLPEATDDETVARLALFLSRRFGDAPFEPVASSAAMAPVAERLRAHLAGALDDLRDVRLDETGLTPFRVRVGEAARAIPVGEVRSYGELAREVGSPGGSRAVGRAMGTNPFPIIVPCHRVVGTAAVGKMRPGGFSAHGGLVTKARLLEIERSPSARAISDLANAER